MRDLQLCAGIRDGTEVDTERRRPFAQQGIRAGRNVAPERRPVQLALAPPMLFGRQGLAGQPVIDRLPADTEAACRDSFASAAPDKRHHTFP